MDALRKGRPLWADYGVTNDSEAVAMQTTTSSTTLTTAYDNVECEGESESKLVIADDNLAISTQPNEEQGIPEPEPEEFGADPEELGGDVTPSSDVESEEAFNFKQGQNFCRIVTPTFDNDFAYSPHCAPNVQAVPLPSLVERSENRERAPTEQDFVQQYSCGSDGSLSVETPIASQSQVEKPPEWVGCRVAMIRKLPSVILKDQLVAEIGWAGFGAHYEFINFPMGYNGNRGFAFVGFFTEESAWAFKLHFDGNPLAFFGKHKAIMVIPADPTRSSLRPSPVDATPIRKEPAPIQPENRRRGRGGRSLIDWAKQLQMREQALSAMSNSASVAAGPNYNAKGPRIGPASSGSSDYTDLRYSAPSVSVGQYTPAITFCPFCQSAIRPQWIHCTSCGQCIR